MGGMGVRNKPMDDLTRKRQLVRGRPSAAHATPFRILEEDIEGKVLD
jgi:hypothetical protein